MSYKTRLLHVADSAQVGARIEVAATIAIAQEAHLIGAASIGVSRLIEEAVAANPYNPTVTPYLDTLRQQASARLDKFDEQVRRIGVHSFERRLIDDEASGGIIVQAHRSDLVVVGQSDPEEPTRAIDADLPEYVAVSSGTPVLISRRRVNAFNGNLSSARALRNRPKSSIYWPLAGLPLLSEPPADDPEVRGDGIAVSDCLRVSDRALLTRPAITSFGDRLR